MGRMNTVLSRYSLRERWFLGGGVLGVMVLITYVLWVGPTWDRLVLLQRLIPQKEKEMVEFAVTTREYKTDWEKVKRQEERLTAPPGFSPLSFLEESASKNKIRQNIVYIRPAVTGTMGMAGTVGLGKTPSPYKETQVEVRLENVTLLQAVPFLRAIEDAPLRMKRLSMKTRLTDSSLMDIVVWVSSYEKMILPRPMLSSGGEETLLGR